MLNIKRLSMIASLLLLIGVIGSMATYKFIAKPETLTEEITITDVTDIEVSTNNGKIELVPTNEGNTRIEVSGYRLSDNFSTTVVDSTLSITYKETTKKFYSFGLTQELASIKVYIPRKNYRSVSAHADNGKLTIKEIEADYLNLKANNGKISADELNAQKINLSAKNGTIDLQEVHSNELYAKSNNGRITADSLSGTLFELEANNGRIILTDVTADSSSIISHNGKVKLEEITGALLAKANNGSIQLVTNKLAYPIDFSTRNGKIQIQTKQDPEDVEIQAQAKNGSIKIFGEKNTHALFGSGKNKIDLSSNNGRIIVEKQ